MNVSDVVDISIGLSETPAAVSSFNIPVLFVDHADVPIDQKLRLMTRSTYATLLTAATEQLGWCTDLWGQNYNPAAAYIARWISAATASHAICPLATQVASVYAALAATAQLGVKEGAAAAVDITPDFTGDTTMADVCASIQAAMSGAVAGYTCAQDKIGRIVITSDNTGASADAVTLVSPAAGTDLTGAAYLGTETSIPGYDAETLAAAMTRTFNTLNSPFIVCQRGASISQAVAFSTALQALNKLAIIVDDDANAKSSVPTSDIGYQVKALSHKKTYLPYTEHTVNNGASADQYPDAALIGEVMSRTDKEGAVSMALNGLSGVSQSGLDIDKSTVIAITPTEGAALVAKGYDYLVKPSSITHFVHGLTAGGTEVRVIIGRAYLAGKAADEIYAYLLANDVVTFSDGNVQAIKSICAYWVDEMIKRGLLDGDSVVWNFPEAADFTAAQKASHTMTLSEVMTADVLSAVNDIVMSMVFAV